jgi:thymidine kinase
MAIITFTARESIVAKLYFRYGAMNCGKSTALIQVNYNYRERKMKTVIIKPETDTKGSSRVISRLGVTAKSHILANKVDNLYRLIEKWNRDKGPIHCVLVDEAQFLTHAQVDQLFKVAVLKDIPVICYGLRADFQLNGFEGSIRLLLLAHSIEELKTICKCGQKAVANGRKIKGQFVFEGAQVAIEGEADVEYESLCATCYFKHKQQYEMRKGLPAG